jgi:ElaA protein
MITFQWLSFEKLSSLQLYSILALRSEVFVVEQKCPYQDIDGKDLETLHLLGMEKDHLAAYLRLFLPTPEQNYLVFGRVVSCPSARKKGYGKKLLQEMVNYCDQNFPGLRIKCSAQYYLKNFYESFGFKAYGDIYDEDGIPHIAMEKI